MPNYSHVIFKDKTDQTPEFRNAFPGAQFVGAMEKFKPSDEVKVLSVKFSGVGLSAIKAFPNLKYIVCRSHGTDNINMELCEEHGITVSACYPTTKHVARYIVNNLVNLKAQAPFLFYGFGSIAKEVCTILYYELPDQGIKIINSKTSYVERQRLISGSNTLIVTIPATEQTKGIICQAELLGFTGKIISISHAQVLNNFNLLELIQSGKVEYLVADCLSMDYREELLATGKVLFTKHQAWNCDSVVLEKEYITSVKKCIDYILIGGN